MIFCVEMKSMEKVKIRPPFIKLGQLLKFIDIIESGGSEKEYLETHDILVNGESVIAGLNIGSNICQKRSGEGACRRVPIEASVEGTQRSTCIPRAGYPRRSSRLIVGLAQVYSFCVRRAITSRSRGSLDAYACNDLIAQIHAGEMDDAHIVVIIRVELLARAIRFCIAGGAGFSRSQGC